MLDVFNKNLALGMSSLEVAILSDLAIRDTLEKPNCELIRNREFALHQKESPAVSLLIHSPSKVEGTTLSGGLPRGGIEAVGALCVYLGGQVLHFAVLHVEEGFQNVDSLLIDELVCVVLQVLDAIQAFRLVNLAHIRVDPICTLHLFFQLTNLHPEQREAKNLCCSLRLG